MRRILSFLFGLVILLIAFWVSPFLAIRDMAANVQARDARALSERVDFVSLRRSLSQQIITAYLRVTGRADRLGGFATAVVAGLNTSVADPIVAQIINSENLVKLLGNHAVTTEFGDLHLHFGPLPSDWLASGWRAWLNSEYGIGRFSIGLPFDFKADDQFRFRMKVIRWRWKLTGLDLPEQIQIEVARQLAKKYP
jgi:DUF2939 family protein